MKSQTKNTQHKQKYIYGDLNKMNKKCLHKFLLKYIYNKIIIKSGKQIKRRKQIN